MATYEVVEDSGPAAPYAEGQCRIDVQLDAWHNDAGKELPFWLHITSMNDNDGQTLEPTDAWVNSGASFTMTSTSKLEDVIEMIPIKAPDASIPYIQFRLGAQQWRSDEQRLDLGAFPGCNVTPCLSCADGM